MLRVRTRAPIFQLSTLRYYNADASKFDNRENDPSQIKVGNEPTKQKDSAILGHLSKILNFKNMFLNDTEAARTVENVRRSSPFFRNAETIFTFLRIMNLIVIVAFIVYIVWFYSSLLQNEQHKNASKIE